MTDNREPPREEVVRQFVGWLEDRGAVFRFRRNGTITTTDWFLDLNGVPDMTRDEAGEISEAAFEIRDAIRELLLARRVPTIH